MVTISTFWKYIIADQNEKISEMLTLVTVFFHNTPNNTHKTNNNHKVQALVTEQKKKSEKCLLVIQKWALE